MSYQLLLLSFRVMGVPQFASRGPRICCGYSACSIPSVHRGLNLRCDTSSAAFVPPYLSSVYAQDWDCLTLSDNSSLIAFANFMTVPVIVVLVRIANGGGKHVDIDCVHRCFCFRCFAGGGVGDACATSWKEPTTRLCTMPQSRRFSR